MTCSHKHECRGTSLSNQNIKEIVANYIESNFADFLGDLSNLEASLLNHSNQIDIVNGEIESIISTITQIGDNVLTAEDLTTIKSDLVILIREHEVAYTNLLDNFEDSTEATLQDFRNYLESIRQSSNQSLLDMQRTLEELKPTRDAFKVAQDNGFNGTESEWLESLKGKSAYEIAVLHGFNGSEGVWVSSLRGPKGDKGVPGDSAFEIAKQLGFVGNKKDWLDSLKNSADLRLLDKFYTASPDETIEREGIVYKPFSYYEQYLKAMKDIVSVDSGYITVEGQTFQSINELFRDVVLNLGYVIKGSFTSGAYLENASEVIIDVDGNVYRWGGAYPKNVPVTSSPESTGGFSDTSWVLVSDMYLRNHLSKPGGVSLVTDSAFIFDTLEDLKKALWVTAGSTVQTRGFNSIDDGAGRYYKVVSGAPTVGNYVTLNNGLAALPSSHIKKSFPQYHYTQMGKAFDSREGVGDVMSSWTHATVAYDEEPNKFVVFYNTNSGHSISQCSVLMRTKSVESEAFSEPVIVASDKGNYSYKTQAAGIAANGDYIALVARFPWGSNSAPNSFVYRSKNRGLSFTRELMTHGGAPIAAFNGDVSGFLVTQSGRILTIAVEPGSYTMRIFYSDDHGVTWEKSTIAGNPTDNSEPAWCDLGGGKLICMAREAVRRGGTNETIPAKFLRSEDNGLTWSEPVNSKYITNFTLSNGQLIPDYSTGTVEFIHHSRRADTDGMSSILRSWSTLDDAWEGIFEPQVRVGKLAAYLPLYDSSGDSGYVGAAKAKDGTINAFYYTGKRNGAQISWIVGLPNTVYNSNKVFDYRTGEPEEVHKPAKNSEEAVKYHLFKNGDMPINSAYHITTGTLNELRESFIEVNVAASPDSVTRRSPFTVGKHRNKLTMEALYEGIDLTGVNEICFVYETDLETLSMTSGAYIADQDIGVIVKNEYSTSIRVKSNFTAAVRGVAKLNVKDLDGSYFIEFAANNRAESGYTCYVKEIYFVVDEEVFKYPSRMTTTTDYLLNRTKGSYSPELLQHAFTPAPTHYIGNPAIAVPYIEKHGVKMNTIMNTGSCVVQLQATETTSIPESSSVDITMISSLNVTLSYDTDLIEVTLLNQSEIAFFGENYLYFYVALEDNLTNIPSSILNSLPVIFRQGARHTSKDGVTFLIPIKRQLVSKLRGTKHDVPIEDIKLNILVAIRMALNETGPLWKEEGQTLERYGAITKLRVINNYYDRDEEGLVIEHDIDENPIGSLEGVQTVNT